MASASGSQQARQLGGGANQSGGRAYNERLILSLIRRQSPLPKAELARMTGLSPQTVTQIVNQLEADGVVVRAGLQRGRVGQPAVPYALNPAGAFSIGLKIGRRSVEIALVDLVGAIRLRARLSYACPTPEAVVDFAGEQVRRMRRFLPPLHRARLAGIGVAIPFRIWEWSEEMEAPPQVMQAWQEVDIHAAIEAATRLPVFVSNDATAACGAELAGARQTQEEDFAYLFVGWFIGGGLVLNGSLYAGRNANAGAFGSMPVWAADGPIQLLRVASLYGLEQRLLAHGLDPSPLWASDVDWPDFGLTLDAWIDEAARAIAQSIGGVLSVIDLPSVLIDGAMPEQVRDRLVAAISLEFARVDRRGLSPVQIAPGQVGADARLLGASMLPILARFTRNNDVLFKATAEH